MRSFDHRLKGIAFRVICFLPIHYPLIVHHDVASTLAIAIIRTHSLVDYDNLFIFGTQAEPRFAIFKIYQRHTKIPWIWTNAISLGLWDSWMHVVAIAISWLDYSAELLSVLTINFSLVATLTYRPSVANDDTRSRIYLSPRLSILPSSYLHFERLYARLHPVEVVFSSFKSDGNLWLFCTETIWMFARHNYKLSRLLVG